MTIKVTSEEYHNGDCLTWDDTGAALSKREGQAWWAGWDEGRKDGDADARDELEPEIKRLREALKAFSCDCEENQCAEWGEDGPRFDCVFRRYRSLVEKE